MDEIGVLILAAGSSSRLGRPKQLVKSDGKPLVAIAVEICMEAGFKNLNLVLGYEHEKIEKEVAHHPVRILLNKDWQLGIGKSLAVGLRELFKLDNGKLEGLLIYLADQPFITAPHLQALYAAFLKSKEIAASGYENTFGPPLICGKSYFDLLENLQGDEGAKKVFKGFPHKMTLVPFESAKFDIDHKEDLKQLKKGQ